MEVKADNCDNCYNRHITSVAVNWCAFCSEGLCSLCTEHHQASKILKYHSLMQISEYHKLPYYIREYTNCCQNHEQPFQLYCHTHEQCCCLSCVKETHTKCEDIEALSDVIKDVKSSPALEDIETCLKTIITVYDNIKENRLENKSRLAEQKETIMTEVHTIRKSIDDHLDNLLNSIETMISTEFESANLKIDEVLTEVEERQKHIQNLTEEERTIKQLSTDLQTFLGMPFFQDRIKEETEYLEKLEREHKTNELNLVFRSEVINSIREQNNSFGTVSVSQGHSLIDFHVGKKERAQILLPKNEVCDKIVSDVHRIQYPIKVQKTHMTGCTILPTGQIILVDAGNEKIFIRKGLSSQKNSYREIIRLEDLWDVSLIDKTTAVATNKNNMTTIDLLTGKQLKSFDLGDTCWGIESLHSSFTVKSSGVFLTVDSKTGNILKRISCECLTYLTANDDRIFGSNEKDIVYCYDADGEELWQFHDEKLSHPQDLTIDDQGFVYVTGTESNNVIVISPDGKTFKEILNQSDGLDSPIAIHFEKTLGVLLVCNKKNGAVTCNIRQST